MQPVSQIAANLTLAVNTTAFSRLGKLEHSSVDYATMFFFQAVLSKYFHFLLFTLVDFNAKIHHVMATHISKDLHSYSAVSWYSGRFSDGGSSSQPPPKCSTNLGDARQPFCSIKLPTHQLLTESYMCNSCCTSTLESNNFRCICATRCIISAVFWFGGQHSLE